MSRSAKGNREQPGKRVRQKAGLNRCILDQGWAEFRRQLAYKMDWSGGLLQAVPAHYTSQTCPCCGHVAPENRRAQQQFQCVACGHTAHADVVGAVNILERGLRLLACGEEGSGRNPQQESPAFPLKRWPQAKVGEDVKKTPLTQGANRAALPHCNVRQCEDIRR